MKRKRLFAAVLGGALLFSAGCGKQQAQEEAPKASTAVEVVETTAGEMSAEHTLTGKVEAVNAVQVFPMLAGQVVSLAVKEGDQVTKGQTLFTVDTSTVTSTLGSLQQSYAATRAATDQAIANARITVEQAQLAVDNVKALFEVGAAAQQDVTKAEQGLQQAKIGLASAQAQQTASLAQIQASMDQINKQVSLGTVTAPCAGTLTVVNLVAGGMAASAQPAVIIAENGKVEVQVSVAEDVYTNIKEGENADVVISVLGDTVIHGTIGPLPAAANMQTSLYDISVALPDTVTPPIGAFATVTFYTNRRAEALHVPTEALLTGENDEQYVFVVDDFGDGETVTRVTVETGLVGKTDTEIVSGLSEGDRVVVKGQSYLTDGEAVRVVTGEAGLAPEGGSDDIADGGSDDAADGGEG